ncbi:MAG: mannose-1-phosphate guanylyltransferase [Smithella sp. SDB]|nr:MAG: mannose-1-phosphate guanylyltransferase [Smithella sp. SDB]
MYAVIMAGGRGTRFWPRSRGKKPKHLLDITSKKTIIQETVDRIKPIINPDNILIVTGKKHSGILIKQLPEIPLQNIIIEPEGKNTAACIGLAALHVQKRALGEIMVVLPSDHAIADSREFNSVIEAAAKTAAQEEGLVTIGIKPSSANTGFGYIEQADLLKKIDGKEIFHVKSIREKPDFQQAQAFIQNGNFFWNSGMFIWKISTILKEINRWLPDLYAGLMKINEVLGSPDESIIVPRVYKKLKSISIDYGVMEKANNVFMLKGDFGWSDVGSWDALWEISAKDRKGNVVTGGSNVIFEDTEGSLVYCPQKLVATVGVKDLIIVETKDALLICKKGSSQDVKKIVEVLEEKKLKKYL